MPPLDGQASKLMDRSEMLVRLNGSIGIFLWHVGPGGLFENCGLLVLADIIDLIKSWVAKTLRVVSVTKTASDRNLDSYLRTRIKALMRTIFCSSYRYNDICQREKLSAFMRAILDIERHSSLLVI